MSTLSVLERLPINEASRSKSGSRLLIQIITPGWGSSGYYSEAVLKQAAADKVFAAGTHMYIDHPTATEDEERPVRSVKDLAATLVEDAYIRNGALVARAKPLNGWGAALAEMKDAIGVSIRAGAMASVGEAEGRQGLIVDELLEAKSVDFVTKAGRGGRILEVLESARRAEIPAREAHGMTANDLRDALCAAVKDAYGGKDVWAWVRDYTDEWVVYTVETNDTSDLYQQPYAVAGGAVSLAADRTEVTARTTFVPVAAPVAEAAPSPTTTTTNTANSTVTVTLPDGIQATRPLTIAVQPAQLSEAVGRALVPDTVATGGYVYVPPKSVTAGAPPPAPTPKTTEESMGTQTGSAPDEAGQAEVTEAATATAARLAVAEQQLVEAQARAATLAESQQQRALAEAERDRYLVEARTLRANDTARTTVARMLAESSIDQVLRPLIMPRLTTAVLGRVPLTESGDVDATALEEAITAAIKAEQTYAAQLLEATGAGVPQGLGVAAPRTLSEADVTSQLLDVFTSIGLDDATANLAAKGR